MLKKITWFIVLALLGAGGWIAFKWYRAQDIPSDTLRLIPGDAIYCLATDDPIKAWKEISSSRMWHHLRGNDYFAALTASADNLDSLIRENNLLLDLAGSHTLIASAHMTAAKQYDFLFLIDLKGVAGIKFLNEYLGDFSAENYSLKKEKYKDNDVLELYNSDDKSHLYISLPGSYLIASYTKKIIFSALDAQAGLHPLAQENFMNDAAGLSTGSMKLYINYAMLPKFMNCYADGTNEYVKRLAASLKTTSLRVSLENDLIKATGTTIVNDSLESYVKTLAISGKGGSEFLEITPQRAGFVLGLGFESFKVFFENFEKNLQQDVTGYKSYRDNLKQVENFLNISVQNDFIDWIGDEVALLELQSSGKGLDNETAVILKATNIESAKDHLEHVEKMIRRRTPVKFKTVEYRGYSIKYLGMKGLFKILLGKFFARYDKPYYVVINNFVVFSSHPQTLESMIDDYLTKNTLIKSPEFKTFHKEFEDESAAFIYLNTPVLFNTIKKMADAPTRVAMEGNKEYMVCFRHIGFQLVPDKNGFKTLLAEQFTEPEKNTSPTEQTETITSPAETGEDIDTLISEPVTENADPMELPYIYVKNLNAKSYIDYFADSTVHFEVKLKNGFKDGDFTEYYENGEVKMTGKFKRDKRDGNWRLYSEDGKLKMKRNYENGEITKERLKN